MYECGRVFSRGMLEFIETVITRAWTRKKTGKACILM